MHVRDLVFERWRGADDEVVLKADAVDWGTVGLDELDDVESGA